MSPRLTLRGEGAYWRGNDQEPGHVHRASRLSGGAAAPADFQFLRLGYFCVDNRDSSPAHLVFNRAVALKDSFKK